jgi:hypothetical protein
MAFIFDYTNLQSLTVNGGSGNSSFNIQGTAANTTTTINGGSARTRSMSAVSTTPWIRSGEL